MHVLFAGMETTVQKKGNDTQHRRKKKSTFKADNSAMTTADGQGEEGNTNIKKQRKPRHRKGRDKKDNSGADAANDAAAITVTVSADGEGKGKMAAMPSTKFSQKKHQQPQKGPMTNKVPRSSQPTNKTYYKVIIRRLPATELNKEQFIEALEKAFSSLDERFVLNGTSIRLLHYNQGKVSRARGNISSTAYLAFDDIELKNKFLLMVPSKVRYL